MTGIKLIFICLILVLQQRMWSAKTSLLWLTHCFLCCNHLKLWIYVGSSYEICAFHLKPQAAAELPWLQLLLNCNTRYKNDWLAVPNFVFNNAKSKGGWAVNPSRLSPARCVSIFHTNLQISQVLLVCFFILFCSNMQFLSAFWCFVIFLAFLLRGLSQKTAWKTYLLLNFC